MGQTNYVAGNVTILVAQPANSHVTKTITFLCNKDDISIVRIL